MSTENQNSPKRNYGDVDDPGSLRALYQNALDCEYIDSSMSIEDFEDAWLADEIPEYRIPDCIPARFRRPAYQKR